MAPILLGRPNNFKRGPPLIGIKGFGLKDLARRANKLRRRVYREMPVASVNRTAELPRVVSMNVCTDQLLLSLADPVQILGLSRFSRDDWQSWAAADARRYPRLSGGAEDVLVLKPDVVMFDALDLKLTPATKPQNVLILEVSC